MKYLFKKERGTLVFMFILAIFSLFMKPAFVNAQQQVKDLSFIKDSQESISFPFRFINNLIILPVVINDSDTLNFILDTGVSTSIMTELSIGDSLSLSYTRKIKIGGLGQGESIDALQSSGNKFHISGIHGLNQDLIILLQNVFNLSSAFGTRIHGLLGYNIFQNFIVEINYSKKIISFHKPDMYEYNTGWWIFQNKRKKVTLPLTIHNTKPYINASITLEDRQKVPVKLLLDTGASHALWLNQSSDTLIKVPDNNAEIFLGKGLNGDIFGKLGRISGISVGNFNFSNPVVAFPDSASSRKTRNLDFRNGTIGAELLRRFNLIIEYPNNKITLIKNRNFNNKFKINRCGIDIETPIPDLPYYIISHIRKGSPADKAGLRRGDEIKYINNSSVYNLSLNDIYEFFYRKPGKKIRLGIKRGKFNFSLIIYLTDFIPEADRVKN